MIHIICRAPVLYNASLRDFQGTNYSGMEWFKVRTVVPPTNSASNEPYALLALVIFFINFIGDKSIARIQLINYSF